MTTAEFCREMSVIVPCFGRIDALEACLRSLHAQTLDRDAFEVIVVDDGNTPPLRQQLGADLLNGFTLLRLDENRGPAAARNAALEIAKGRILLLLNADAVPDADACEKHLRHHPPGAPPRAMLGRFDLVEHCTSVLSDFAGRIIFPFHRLEPMKPSNWICFWTSNLSVPADCVRDVGGFDDTFRRAIWEDVELGFRLEQAGVRVWYDPEIGCGHDHPISLDYFVWRHRLYGSESVRFQRKHGPVLNAGMHSEDDMVVFSVQAMLKNEPGMRAMLTGIQKTVDELAPLRAADPAAYNVALEEKRPAMTAVETICLHEGYRGSAAAMGGIPLESLGENGTANPTLSVAARAADVSRAHKLLDGLNDHDALFVISADDDYVRDSADARVARAPEGSGDRLLEALANVGGDGIVATVRGAIVPDAALWQLVRDLLLMIPTVGAVTTAGGFDTHAAQARVTWRTEVALTAMRAADAQQMAEGEDVTAWARRTGRVLVAIEAGAGHA